MFGSGLCKCKIVMIGSGLCKCKIVMSNSIPVNNYIC